MDLEAICSGAFQASSSSSAALFPSSSPPRTPVQKFLGSSSLCSSSSGSRAGPIIQEKGMSMPAWIEMITLE